MYTGTYRIAGRSIAIESQYPDVHAYCAAYRHAGEPDFTIRITPADIDRERDKSAREDQRQGIAPVPFRRDIWRSLRCTGRSPTGCLPMTPC